MWVLGWREKGLSSKTCTVCTRLVSRTKDRVEPLLDTCALVSLLKLGQYSLDMSLEKTSLCRVEPFLVKFPVSIAGKSKGLDVNKLCLPGQPKEGTSNGKSGLEGADWLGGWLCCWRSLLLGVNPLSISNYLGYPSPHSTRYWRADGRTNPLFGTMPDGNSASPWLTLLDLGQMLQTIPNTA